MESEKSVVGLHRTEVSRPLSSIKLLTDSVGVSIAMLGSTYDFADFVPSMQDA